MKQPLKEKAYHYILNKISHGELSSGDQISEALIAKELGISRSPVHDALSQMATLGMVEQLPRFGTVIKKFSAKEVSCLYDLRIALESFAAAKAAESAPPEILEKLQALCNRLDVIANKLPETTGEKRINELISETSHIDMDFHLLVLRATENPMLMKSAYDTNLLTRVFGISQSTTPVFDAEHIIDICQYHRGIYEAIKDGKPKKAASVITKHIEVSKQFALKFLDKIDQEQQKQHFSNQADKLPSLYR